MKYFTQIARPHGLTPTAGTPRVSAWTCTGTRQHLPFDEENMASKSCPGMAGRAAPDANQFCIKAVKIAFFFYYDLQVFPLVGVALVLSAPQTFPAWHHPSAFTCFSRRSSPLNTPPLPGSLLLPCFYLLPRAKAAESLSKQPGTWSAFCLPSSLPKGFVKRPGLILKTTHPKQQFGLFLTI